MITNEYCAGFFDGEGYIGIGSNKRVEIRIVQVSLPVLQRLRERFGGNIYERKKQENRKKTWEYVICDKEGVSSFIDAVYPFLLVKKTQVDNALEKRRLLHVRTYNFK